MRVFCLAILAVILASLVAIPAPASASSCTFELGFAALHDLIPQTIGTCKVNEHHNPTNGDSLQETTGGLLVWRKADNWTAFTDGYHTWINGPKGLQERLNTQCFAWEAGCGLPGFAKFVQPWWHHDFSLTVHPNGSADGISQMATVLGTSHLEFYEVSGQSAFARVTASTGDGPSVGSTAILTLLPYDQARLTVDQGLSKVLLCGPHFGENTPPEVIASYPCGI